VFSANSVHRAHGNSASLGPTRARPGRLSTYNPQAVEWKDTLGELTRQLNRRKTVAPTDAQVIAADLGVSGPARPGSRGAWQTGPSRPRSWEMRGGCF
jgi:hypothetical protein